MPFTGFKYSHINYGTSIRLSSSLNLNVFGACLDTGKVESSAQSVSIESVCLFWQLIFLL